VTLIANQACLVEHYSAGQSIRFHNEYDVCIVKEGSVHLALQKRNDFAMPSITFESTQSDQLN
jgi:hypothetical protein